MAYKVELSLLILVAACCLKMEPASAMYHVVGGSLGWSVPPNKTYFQDWAKKRVFGVEDKLLFPFRTSLHNVVEVGAGDFEGCTKENLINIYTKGPLIMNFTQPGDHYYYSGVGLQCESGLKLHVTVVPGKGSSGRVFTRVGSITSVPAPAPAPTLSTVAAAAATANPILGWGMAMALMVWIFL
ncbi:hypothetical protein U1Q18_021171 [Sarracenia purpurea var. burkii]